MFFLEIDKKKNQLDSLRPLPTHTVKSIREHLLIHWTYHSNAIEGNTLTLSETKVALEGITIGGKTINEHLEAINHKEAILYIEDIIRKNEPFSEWQLKSIHRLILKGIDDFHAGVYRKQNVLISGATHIPPDAVDVAHQMENLVSWYETEAQQQHPIERAANLHIIFVQIHPFIDGNGRTARLLLNLELMKSGFPPIVIEKENRLDYYNALDTAHTLGDNREFLLLVKDVLNKTFDTYFNLIK